MRTKVLLTVAAILMLVISLVAIGSNMGFKISIPLAAGTSINWVSIPFYNSYTTAHSMFADVTGCSEVARWDNTSVAYQTWNGSRGTNFAVTPGEAYSVKVSSPTNWIVVGSHNPTLGLTLAAGTSINWVSVPYHTTATTAGTLFTQITSCSEVARWDNTSVAYQTWNGSRGTNFALTAGEGLSVKVSAGGSWTPAHY